MDYIFVALEVWVLSQDPQAVSVVRSTLDANFELKAFETAQSLANGLGQQAQQKPSLLILDAESAQAREYLSMLTPERLVVGRACPILVMSGKDELDGIKKFCGHGDFDFIMKPLQDEECRLRMSVILGSASRHVSYTLALLRSFGSDLTSTELKILFCFLSKHGRPINRAEIMDLIWGASTVHPKTLDVHLFNLRRKLAVIGYQITSGRGGVWSLKRNENVSRIQEEK